MLLISERISIIRIVYPCSRSSAPRDPRYTKCQESNDSWHLSIWHLWLNPPCFQSRISEILRIITDWRSSHSWSESPCFTFRTLRIGKECEDLRSSHPWWRSPCFTFKISRIQSSSSSSVMIRSHPDPYAKPSSFWEECRTGDPCWILMRNPHVFLRGMSGISWSLISSLRIHCKPLRNILRMSGIPEFHTREWGIPQWFTMDWISSNRILMRNPHVSDGSC